MSEQLQPNLNEHKKPSTGQPPNNINKSQKSSAMQNALTMTTPTKDTTPTITTGQVYSSIFSSPLWTVLLIVMVFSVVGYFFIKWWADYYIKRKTQQLMDEFKQKEEERKRNEKLNKEKGGN